VRTGLAVLAALQIAAAPVDTDVSVSQSTRRNPAETGGPSGRSQMTDKGAWSPEAIAAREAQILGEPPRIAPLPPSAMTPEAKEIVLQLRLSAGKPDTADLPEFYRIMLRHPGLFRAYFALAQHYFQTRLCARDREMVILRTGWLLRAPFQWGAHTGNAKQAGMTEAEIERITEGSAAPGWSEHDRAVLRAVEELIGDAMISDETWAALARDLDDQQLIELPLLVGHYQGVANLQNSLRLPLRPGAKGLTGR
jgi:alkylhydroperoxidase family enzyme